MFGRHCLRRRGSERMPFTLAYSFFTVFPAAGCIAGFITQCIALWVALLVSFLDCTVLDSFLDCLLDSFLDYSAG